MFSGDDFPLGPNGQYPRQRISSAGNEIAAPEEMEVMYERSDVARLPVVEKDFHSSVDKVKGGMKQGRSQDGDEDVDQFRPRYAPKTKLRRFGEEEEEESDGLGWFRSRMFRRR